MYLFVSSTPLSSRNVNQLHQKLNVCPKRAAPIIRVSPRAASGDKNGRSPWPFSRFIQTALFFSPFGKILRGKQPDPAADVRDKKISMARAQKLGSILVTGASGGTGRRVVRELLGANRKVVTITRTRARLIKALAKEGIDVEAEEKKGNLKVFVTDLYNIPADLFEDVVGIASCTGTKIGPVDDDIDRTKYYQGRTFYPPEVLEDCPENVEYVGIKKLIEVAQKHFGTSSGDIPVLDFSDSAKVRKLWASVDDVVMGGVSNSKISVEDGEFVFSGETSTNNNGGFASARTVNLSEPINLSDYDGLSIRVKGDGQRYKMILRCEEGWDTMCHCLSFDTKKGEWMNLKLPFANFNTVFRAKTVKDGKPLDPSSIVAFQLMVSKFEYDGDLNPSFTPGPFEIRVSSINAYSSDMSKTYPKIVHVGSAASTRMLRLDEIGPESIIPAMELSEKIGRLLNWKLAGEDVIRTSGIPYVILRFCALTEEEDVGLDMLDFQQGDLVTGRIPRNDVAKLILKAFSTAQFTGKTSEVRAVEDGNSKGSVDEQATKLKVDNESERTYAAYPYVPEKITVTSET